MKFVFRMRFSFCAASSIETEKLLRHYNKITAREDLQFLLITFDICEHLFLLTVNMLPVRREGNSSSIIRAQIFLLSNRDSWNTKSGNRITVS